MPISYMRKTPCLVDSPAPGSSPSWPGTEGGRSQSCLCFTSAAGSLAHPVVFKKGIPVILARRRNRGIWYGELVRVRSRVLLVEPEGESSYLAAEQRKSLRALLQGLRGPGWQAWAQQSQSPAVEKCGPGYLSVTVTCVQT